SHDGERLGHKQTDAGSLSLPGLGNVDAFECCVIANVVGRVAVRRLPFQLALVEIDGCEHAVRRLRNGYSIDGQREADPRRNRASSPGETCPFGGLRRLGRAAVAWPKNLPELTSADAGHVANIGEFAGRFDK